MQFVRLNVVEQFKFFVANIVAQNVLWRPKVSFFHIKINKIKIYLHITVVAMEVLIKYCIYSFLQVDQFI